MYWNVILLLFATISQGFGRESVCSKFHYEEQLLEKMIRQEIKVQEMETEIKKTLESISTFMENMEQKMNIKADDLNSETMNKVSTFMDDIQRKIVNIKDEMQQKMEDYKDDLTDRKNELQLLADKVDVPRVAFNAYNVNDVNIKTRGQVFIFTTILLNEGNGYDSSTGKCTASVAGLYYFTAHVCVQPGKYVFYGIIVDDEKVASSVQREADEYTCSSVSAITVLKTGSSVSVQSTISHPYNILYQESDRYHVSFSGALLHK